MKALMVSFLCLVLVSGVSFAVPVFEDGEEDLVEFFNVSGLTAQGYDHIDDQQMISYWKPVDNTTVAFAWSDLDASFNPNSEFGIFSMNSGEKLTLFTPSHGKGELSQAQFNADGSVSVIGTNGFSNNSSTNFGMVFGFYWKVDATTTFYSDPTMNPSWTPTWDPTDNNTYNDFFLFYQGFNGLTVGGNTYTSNDWVIAAEGAPQFPSPVADGLLDFDDAIMISRGMMPFQQVAVPEPAAGFMLISAILPFLFFAARNRKQENA